MAEDCAAITARITALERMLDEREDRTKERFIALDKSVNVAMSAADKAVTKAEVATEKRFEGVNEFRQTLADQAATLLPRSEFQVQHTAIMDKMEGMDQRLASLETGFANLQGRIWAVGAIWSVVAVAVSIGVRFIGH